MAEAEAKGQGAAEAQEAHRTGAVYEPDDRQGPAESDVEALAATRDPKPAQTSTRTR